MEKARIINSSDWGGNHPQKWLEDNQDLEIGGQLVSEWTLTPILPDESFILKKWNGNSWYEGVSQEEIQQNNLEKIKENVRQFLSKKKKDGKTYFEDFELIITMQLAGMLIVDLVAVTNEIDTILYKPLNLIKNGDFFSAMMLFNNPNTIIPTIPIVLNHWNDIKAFTQNYFVENYPQEPIV